MQVAPTSQLEPALSWSELGGIIRARCRSFAVKVLLPVVAFGLACWTCLAILLTYFLVTPYNDFGKFYYSGIAHARGEDMYQWWPVTPDLLTGLRTLDGEERIYDLLNLNPPHFHLLLLPLLNMPVEVAHMVWLAVGLGCLLLMGQIWTRELGFAWTEKSRQLALIAFLGPVITIDMIQHGQLAWLLVLPVGLLWMKARKNHWLWAGAILGVLVSIKAFFLILAPYFLFRKQFRALGLAVLAALCCFAAGVLVFGVDNHRSWLAALAHADDWAWYPKNASLWAALSRTWHDNPLFVCFADLPLPALKLVWLVLGGGMGLLTLLVALADRSPAGLDRAFALLLIGAVLFSPLGWIYYYWLALPPLAAVLVDWQRRSPLGANGGLFTRRNWRWWFLCLIVPALALPLWSTIWWQPSAVSTLLIGNLYFWIAFAVWLTLIVDGCHTIANQLAQKRAVTFRLVGASG
jgi:hypothetical protein